jgi:hypothetical protein
VFSSPFHKSSASKTLWSLQATEFLSFVCVRREKRADSQHNRSPKPVLLGTNRREIVRERIRLLVLSGGTVIFPHDLTSRTMFVPGAKTKLQFGKSLLHITLHQKLLLLVG